jgi:RimJ/RimL family protein N-acetyltransferase
MTAVRLRGNRLTLREWVDADLTPFAEMNADPEVMRHFAAPLSRDESDAFAARIRQYIDSHGFGLWALDVDGLGFSGFVGLSPPVPFDLAIAGIEPHPHEIGWRLARSAWRQGYASEAAQLALDYALDVQLRPQIVSFTAVQNVRSQSLMARIGLTRRGEFDHPRLPEGHTLRRHVLYAIDREERHPGESREPR